MNMRIPNSFSAFPVEGKKPLVDWGVYSKRLPTDEEKQSWMKSFSPISYGIATGPVSKILVLDDDGGLDVKKYPIPQTCTVQTPRGGIHYYFKWDSLLNDKVTTRTEILPKVDIRGQGGFVVFYGWTVPPYLRPLAPPPQWLIDLLPNREQQATDTSKPDNWMLDELNAIEPGNGRKGRTPTFIRVINRLKREGLSEGSMLAMLASWAEKYDYSNKIEALIKDQFKRYPIPAIKQDDSQYSSIEDFLKDQEIVEWLCEGIIAKKSIGFIAGLPETMKTFISMDLAVSASSGEMWLSKFKMNQCKVLYIDQERFKGETQRRFKAIISGKNINSLTLKDSLFIKCGSTTRLNLQPSFDAFRKHLSEINPDLVIIDSFATIHTSEENNRQSIQEVLEKIKELRSEFNCTFIFLSHESKMAFDKEAGDPSIGQMAGSIAIPAAAECVLTVRRHDSESSMVYQTKNTLAPSISPFMVKVQDLVEDGSRISVVGY